MKYGVGECEELFFWHISVVDFFFIQHANTPVPSMQRNCFAGCDSRIT